MAFVQQAAGQTTVSGAFTNAALANERSGASSRKLIKPVFDTYYSQADGISLDELVAKALASNGEIRIARLEADKARARRFQAGSRRNPTLDVEQAVGAFVGDSGEGTFTVGAALPLDLYGVRVRRIQMAEADIAIREAEIAAQQRAVVAKVLDSYSDALSVFRELQVLEELLELDTETARIVQIRVNEGETPPLELNLLQAEFIAGFPPTTPIRLKEDISTARLPYLPASLESGIASALNERPEIRLALLEESLAAAGLRLAKAQGKPELSATTKFSYGRSVIDDPRGPFDQRDRSLSFGVSVSIPVFDRNQGAKAEAEIAIRQAQERKAFAEQIVKSEVAAAFRRVEASRKALNGLQNTVLPMSLKNIE
ncbi:MAG: TolC family protein, partial [Acidobacteria bacterium ACB1]|nr:TolC family protein [Acidobacteria bacterium ACB1]